VGPVLYCEGDDEVRRHVVELLENAGYRVDCVRDGAEAIAFVDRSGTPPAVLLVDVVAGTMTGSELAAAVRRRHPTLPVIFFSGSSDALSRDDAERIWFVNKRHGLRALTGVVAEAIAAAGRP
jgi:two-component system cell cycle sensor histidine kinase/response regulator CckA